MGCSTNAADIHKRFLATPKADGGAEGVTYPLIADTNRTVSDRFGTLNGQFDYDEYGRLTATSDLTCHRGTFILDKEGVILHQSYNFAPLGRDIDAVIRELDAIRRLLSTAKSACPTGRAERPPLLVQSINQRRTQASMRCALAMEHRKSTLPECVVPAASVQPHHTVMRSPAPSGMRVMPLISPLRKGAP